LYEGIDTLIADLSGRAALAVLTNKPEQFARRILDAFGLALHFRWIVGGDQAFARKPDPESLNHLMRQAAVSSERTLFVGDSMIDVETARRAGVRICVALYGFGAVRGNLVLDELDLRARDARELDAAIRRWLASLSDGARSLDE
jgi:phosphoglycolate phosphatase